MFKFLFQVGALQTFFCRLMLSSTSFSCMFIQCLWLMKCWLYQCHMSSSAPCMYVCNKDVLKNVQKKEKKKVSATYLTGCWGFGNNVTVDIIFQFCTYCHRPVASCYCHVAETDQKTIKKTKRKYVTKNKGKERTKNKGKERTKNKGKERKNKLTPKLTATE